MKTTVRYSGTERREQIALAALEIIGEQGLASLSTAALADQVGLSSGGLFRHFASIEEILQEATQIAIRLIEATFPEPDLPPMERIRTLGVNRIRLLGGNPGLTWLLMSKQAYLKLPADSVKQLKTIVTRSKQFLLAAVRDGAGDGSIRSDLNAEALLITILGTVHTLIGMPGTPEEREAKAEEVIDSLLIMLRPVAPQT
jgi:AcrR family transcriptional regulator